GPEGECPTCRRPLGAEYGAVLGILDRQLQAIVDDGRFFRQRLEQLAQPPAAVTTAEAERDTLRDESRRASERAGELRAQAEQALTTHERRAQELAAAVAAERFSEEAFATARERHDQAARALREAELAVAETRGELVAAEAGVREVERRERERAARERQIAERRTEERLHHELDKALS